MFKQANQKGTRQRISANVSDTQPAEDPDDAEDPGTSFAVNETVTEEAAPTTEANMSKGNAHPGALPCMMGSSKPKPTPAKRSGNVVRFNFNVDRASASDARGASGEITSSQSPVPPSSFDDEFAEWGTETQFFLVQQPQPYVDLLDEIGRAHV